MKTKGKLQLFDGSEGPVAPRMEVFTDMERSRYSPEPVYTEDSVDFVRSRARVGGSRGPREGVREPAGVPGGSSGPRNQATR